MEGNLAVWRAIAVRNFALPSVTASSSPKVFILEIS